MKKFKPTLVVSKAFAVPYSFRSKRLPAPERYAPIIWLLLSLLLICAGIFLQVTAPLGPLWLVVIGVAVYIGVCVYIGTVHLSQQFVEAAADRNLDLREKLIGKNLATPRDYSLDELKEIAFAFSDVLEKTNTRRINDLPLGYFGLKEVLLQLIRREPDPEFVQVLIPVALVLSDQIPLSDEEELAFSDYENLMGTLGQTFRGADTASEEGKLAIKEDVNAALSIMRRNEIRREKIKTEWEHMKRKVDEAYQSRPTIR